MCDFLSYLCLLLLYLSACRCRCRVTAVFFFSWLLSDVYCALKLYRLCMLQLVVECIRVVHFYTQQLLIVGA